MKKQLLIAAVAATMTSAAIADISITGDAKFEYRNYDVSAAATYGGVTATGADSYNTTNTEANLQIKGKNGDTSVVMNLEANTHGQASTIGALDIEDMYVTTSIADVAIKAGNFATGTSALLGEIDNGGRATNKVHISTTLNGVKVYAGDAGAAAGVGETVVKGNMYYGVSADVAGFTVQAKHNSPTTDSFGISGDLSGVSVRYETKDVDGANNDVDFLNVTTSVNGVDLGYAMIDADADGKITEDDSSIFALSNGELTTTGTTGIGDSNQQVSIATNIAGNAVSLKVGEIGFKAAGVKDLEYTQIEASRPLVSGAKLTATYTMVEAGASTSVNGSTLAADADVDVFEVDLSVKF